MAQPKHILVMRFSAMGDVAMTVPVMKEVLKQNPGLQITYVSKPIFGAFFQNIPGLNFVAADVKKRYKGIGGLFILYSDLKKNAQFNAVADLHNVLRTKFLRNLFALSGVKTVIIDKGRNEKKLLTRFPDKVLKPLKRTTERYADVFRKLSLPVILPDVLEKTPVKQATADAEIKKIGISPFAQHKGKIYPLGKMEEVISMLRHESQVKLFLFGGSPQEQEICEQWQEKYSNVSSVVNRLSMAEELELIAKLDVMLSMDSAGMHLASLVGTPVVSIWGATHHYAGFLGYGQSEQDIIADDINCRPCSIYGNKPCFRGDYACMYNIQPETIVDKLKTILTEKA